MAYSDEVLADAPFLYWPLQEASGATTAVDSSVNGRNGTYNGTVVRQAGVKGTDYAQEFDALTDYVQAGVGFAPGAYTVEAWIRVPSGGISGRAVIAGVGGSYNGGNYDGLIWLETNGLLYFYNWYWIGNLSFNVTLARDYYTHVVATTDGTATRVYVNGVQTNSYGQGGTGLNPQSSMVPFVHGGGSTYSGSGTVRVEHVAFYNTALSATRVAAHYNAMLPLSGNPSVNTTTQARFWNQYADVAVVNKPRIQVFNEYVDVAIKNIPRVQVFNQYVDVAVFIPPPGGTATSANTITLVSYPGTAGAYFSVNITGPTAVINMSAIAGTRAALVLGPRADVVVSAGAGDVTVFSIDRSGASIVLSLVQTDVQGLPNTLGVRVAQGLPNAPAYFFLNADTEPVASVYLDPQGGANTVTIPLDITLSGGSNTITVYNTDDRTGASSTATFTISGTSVVDTIPTPYVPVRDVVTQWRFRDYVDPSIYYDFPMNPEVVETPRANAPISDMFTSSPAGKRILFEGASQPPLWSWTGRALTEEHVRALESWARKKQRVYLTDHMGRRLTIKIESLQMTPVRDAERPWHHKYDMKARVFAIEEAP